MPGNRLADRPEPSVDSRDVTRHGGRAGYQAVAADDAASAADDRGRRDIGDFSTACKAAGVQVELA